MTGIVLSFLSETLEKLCLVKQILDTNSKCLNFLRISIAEATRPIAFCLVCFMLNCHYTITLLIGAILLGEIMSCIAQC